MKNVLYIGNALSNKGKTITSVEVLSGLLRQFCDVKIASSKSNKVLRLLDMIWLVTKYRSKADYILIDTYSTSNFYYALVISFLARVFKIRYIPILRGGNLEKRLIHNPKMCRDIFRSAHQLVAPSAFMEEVFKTHGYNQILYIPNTIEIGNYSFNNRPIDQIKLLWVRSFSTIYNPKMAILVLKELIDNGHKANLTMVGPDSDGSLSEVRDLAESLQLEVTFTGKLSKPEWIELSKKSNVFINTTDFDNTPVSVIEAMALGLPVVSTDVGGLPYLISNHTDGILVPPSDVHSMVKEIISLKTDHELKDKIVLNARQKVEQFDWDRIKSKWTALLS